MLVIKCLESTGIFTRSFIMSSNMHGHEKWAHIRRQKLDVGLRDGYYTHPQRFSRPISARLGEEHALALS